MRKITVRSDQGEEAQVLEENLALAEQDGYFPVVINANNEEARVRSSDLPLAQQDGYSLLAEPVDTPAPEAPQAKEISKKESAIRGGLQGVAMEFADEAEAKLLEALGQGTYEELIPKVRQKYEAAAEANPVTYYGSNIGAGLIAPVPGLSLINTGLKGARVAKVAAQAAKSTDQVAAAKALQQAAKSTAGDAAVTGAAAGTIVGAGASEGDDLGEIARDSALGAVLGAGAGYGITKGIEGVKALSETALTATPVATKIKDSFQLGEQSAKEYAQRVKEITAQGKAQGKTDIDIEAEIETIPKPFGTLERYKEDTKKVRELTDDIAGKYTSRDEEGYGLVKMVDDKYEEARKIAKQDGFSIPTEDFKQELLTKVAFDQDATKEVESALNRVVGRATRKQTPEEMVVEAEETLLRDIRNEINKAKTGIQKQSRKEAEKLLKETDQNATAPYDEKLKRAFNVDKRQALNAKANTLRKAVDKKTGKRIHTDAQVEAKIAKDEEAYNKTFRIETDIDPVTNTPVFMYKATTPDGYELQKTIPSDTAFEQFASLSPKEKQKAIDKLTRELSDQKVQELEEASKSLSIKNKKVPNSTQVEFFVKPPPSLVGVLNNRSFVAKPKDIEVPGKEVLDFDDVQTIKASLERSIQGANKAGRVSLGDSVIEAKASIKNLQRAIGSDEFVAKLEEADTFRREIEESDIKLLFNNEKIDPLESKSAAVIDKATLSKTLTDRLRANVSDKADAKSENARKALEELDRLASTGNQEAIKLREDILKAREQVRGQSIQRDMFAPEPGSGSLPRFIENMFSTVTGLALRGAATAGRVSGSVQSKPFTKAMSLVNMNPDSLRSLSNNVQSPILKTYLNRMAEADGPKRKAIMYLLLQNAPLKEELEQAMPNEEN